MKNLVFLLAITLLVPALAANAKDLSKSPWHITATKIDPNNYYGITVANGMVGLVSSPNPMHQRVGGMGEQIGGRADHSITVPVDEAAEAAHRSTPAGGGKWEALSSIPSYSEATAPSDGHLPSTAGAAPPTLRRRSFSPQIPFRHGLHCERVIKTHN